MEKLTKLIEAQQEGHEYTDVWMVGRQLLDICAAEPGCRDLVEKDLESGGMTLKEAADKLKAKADEIQRQTKSNRICIPPEVAEGIIREYFGLPAKGEVAPAAAQEDGLLDLMDLL